MAALRRPGAGHVPSRATLVQVAAAAGVSRQTVSNVLNAPERVAPPTRDRVLLEISRLGFRPNTAARALRRRRAAALGLQVGCPDGTSLGTLTEPFLYELTVAARASDVHVVTFSAADVDDPTAEYEHLLGVRAVDGFLLTDTRHDDPRPSWLRSHAVPFASFGRVWDEPEVGEWVDVDGRTGVAVGVRHLVAQGYESIGFLGWPAGSPVGDDRREGWRSTCAELGLVTDGLEGTTTQDVHEAAAASAPLLDRLGGGGALVCASDTLALGVWTALRDRGLRPGADVGVVGFDDSPLAAAFDLTSLRQPLARIATTMLGLLTREPPAAGRRTGVLLEPSVVERSSSQRIGPPPVLPSTPGSDPTPSAATPSRPSRPAPSAATPSRPSRPASSAATPSRPSRPAMPAADTTRLT